ncbi:DUF5906 domain-containing protein [Burkholderia cenocepacia]|uniref:primase-helicase family protein n=1 Tax=Burkholderia cenocepacia TaxID=95486 RepID=UPI0011782974|nr:primase-helicase family protein [Burkholderia cenocepacia]MCW3688920.1 DUF5906 domain-containing protein [Burkholderia cenocepacia]
MNNNNDKYGNVNIGGILVESGTDANYEYATCLTQEDKDEFEKYSKLYHSKYIFIKNMSGKSLILVPEVSVDEVQGEDGKKSYKSTITYDVMSHKDFKESTVKDTYFVKQENPNTQKNVITEKCFSEFWLKTKTSICRQYERTVFDPNPNFRNLDYFNMWTGFVDGKKGNVEPYISHIHKLIGNKEQAEHLIKLMAYTVKYPHKNTKTSIVLFGEQGCGKTTVSETFRSICPNHSKVVSDLERDLLGSFNDRYIQTKYFLHEESSWAGDKKTANKIKDMITGETRSNRVKYLNGYEVKNYGFHIFTSNSDNPINVESGDRRFNVFECSSELIGNYEYFEKYYKWLDGEGKHALVYYFMNEVDLNGFVPSKIIKTKSHDKVKSNNLNPIGKYLLELLQCEIEWTPDSFTFNGEEGYTCSFMWRRGEIRIGRDIAYEGFLKFCQEHHIKAMDYTKTKFTSELASIFKFEEKYKDNWKSKGVGFYKFKQLNESRKLFCEKFAMEYENIFDLSEYEVAKKESEERKREYEANKKAGMFDHPKKEFPAEVKVEVPKYMPKFGKQEEYYGEEK